MMKCIQATALVVVLLLTFNGAGLQLSSAIAQGSNDKPVDPKQRDKQRDK